MTIAALASIGAAACVVALAGLMRGRLYAIFASLLLSIHTLIALALEPDFEGPLYALFIYLQATVYLHFLLLVWAAMRPIWVRALVSIPASFFVGAVFISFPWAIAKGLGFEPPAVWLPFVVAGWGTLQCLLRHDETVVISIDRADRGDLGRATVRRVKSRADAEGGLTIVQITDPHLGPFMPTARLRRICERAVAADPDLILLTGDFLTMESNRAPEHLEAALAPLLAARGKTFACFGNHDHEAPTLVKRALANAGVKLLMDDAVRVETRRGPVQIVGFDFAFRDRKERMAEVVARHPRTPGVLRLGLLHDPGAFRHLPEDDFDLVLSGHTHGGQIGLVSLGLAATIVSALTSIPDHGLWAKGRSLLYVHRGTGHYGFPIRLGVPREESLLCVEQREPG